MTGEHRPAHNYIRLQNARLRYPVDDLSRALRDLGYRFGTFMDWPVDRGANRDTRAFDATNPDHPHALRNRHPRQEAATFFWMLAEGDPSLVTAQALADLHRSLFDCCAAVRYDVHWLSGI